MPPSPVAGTGARAAPWLDRPLAAKGEHGVAAGANGHAAAHTAPGVPRRIEIDADDVSDGEAVRLHPARCIMDGEPASTSQVPELDATWR